MQYLKNSIFLLSIELDKAENYRCVLIADIERDDLNNRIILTQCDQGNTGAAIAYDSLSHYKSVMFFFAVLLALVIKIGYVFIPFEY